MSSAVELLREQSDRWFDLSAQATALARPTFYAVGAELARIADMIDRGTCYRCGEWFTDDEWLHRHDTQAGEDLHADCCDPCPEQDDAA